MLLFCFLFRFLVGITYTNGTDIVRSVAATRRESRNEHRMGYHRNARGGYHRDGRRHLAQSPADHSQLNEVKS